MRRVFSYYFWSGTFLAIGASVGFGTVLYGHPRINGKTVCPARRPVILLSYVWLAIAIINLMTAWGHAYIETLEDDDFVRMTFQQRLIGFAVKTLPVVTRLCFIYTGFILQIAAVQIVFTPECNGFSLQLGLTIITAIHIITMIFGVAMKTKILVTPYIYDPMMIQRNFFNSLKQAVHAIGP